MTLAKTTPTALARIADATGYQTAQIELIKDTIARGASDDELLLFLHLARRSGLDPFARQIYLIERRTQINNEWKTTRQPQTGIDGLRLIADRSGNYAPGRASTYTYTGDGRLESATAYVNKYVRGAWHEVAATAFYDEYVQTKKDGTPNAMWADKPRIMLSKCAEALALRRAFPAELAGLYTGDEIASDASDPLPATVVDTTTGEILESGTTSTRTTTSGGIMREGIIENVTRWNDKATGTARFGGTVDGQRIVAANGLAAACDEIADGDMVRVRGEPRVDASGKPYIAAYSLSILAPAATTAAYLEPVTATDDVR